MQLVMTFSSALFTLCLWLPSRSPLPITMYAALFGFSSGGMISLVPALVVQISDIRTIGVRTGTLFAMISTAALLGNPVGGSFITRNAGEYWGLQAFAGGMMLAGSCFYAAARVRLAGWGWVKV